MRPRDARRTAALLACLLMATSGLVILLRAAGSGDERRPAAAAEVTEAAPAPSPSATPPRPSATPSAVTATAPAPRPTPTPDRTTVRTTPSPHPATFPALAGASVADGSTLKDVRQDQGISVTLPDGRSIWIFADTTQVSTAPYFFVTSSAAVSPRGSTTLTYAASKRVPVEFLPRTAAERAGQGAGRYTAVWPTGATMLPDGRILISYAKYDVTTEPTTYTLLGAGLYTYRYRSRSDFQSGAQATRYADNLWAPADGAIGSPVYASGFVYFSTCEQLECYSVRTRTSTLKDRSSYQWWTGKGWSASRSARGPMGFGSSRPGLNPSMAYLPEYGVYAIAHTAAGHVSGTGQLWVAPHPWGPWSAAASFTLPNCPASGCYALNVHPNESIGGRVRISYATSGIGPYMRVADVRVDIAANGTSIRIR